MKELSETSNDRMGRLNNAMMTVIDESKATPVEVVMVLRLIVRRMEKAFELYVMRERGGKHGSNVEKTGI